MAITKLAVVTTADWNSNTACYTVDTSELAPESIVLVRPDCKLFRINYRDGSSEYVNTANLVSWRIWKTDDQS